MKPMTSCPNCHKPLSLTSHYCSSCGKKISFTPLSTSKPSQIFLYLKIIIFPPIGFILGSRYLRQSDSKSTLIGFIAITIGFIESILTILYLNHLTTTLIQQISQQFSISNL